MQKAKRDLDRRTVLETGARLAGLGMAAVVAGPMLGAMPALAQAPAGRAEPEEAVADTLKRLFSGKTIKDGAGVLVLDVPPIAENGSVVGVKVDAAKPMRKLWFVADKNRRPMSASFSFDGDGGTLMGTNLRLGGTTKVRAIAEMADGSYLEVAQEVKVTVGGCGG
ncbi:MAG: thiosulfate oxidation carrier protein SoxY [Magnetospirillum sp. WYHS-4]